MRGCGGEKKPKNKYKTLVRFTGGGADDKTAPGVEAWQKIWYKCRAYHTVKLIARSNLIYRIRCRKTAGSLLRHRRPYRLSTSRFTSDPVGSAARGAGGGGAARGSVMCYTNALYVIRGISGKKKKNK